MKICIISISLLYYIIFLHHWNFVESHPTSGGSTTPDSDGSSDTSSVSHVALDLEKTESTNEFNFNDQNGVTTYTSKSGHVFKKVSQGTTDIWESKNNVHGTLVRTTSVSNVKYLVLLLTDNTFTVFHEEGNKWKDITNTKYDVTKLKFFGENDTELKSSDYKVTISGLSFAYMFNSGVKCKKIMLGDAEVWKHTDDTNYSEIKSFSLDLPNNKFLITNLQDLTKELSIKVTLNIQKTESTDQFIFNDQNGLFTFKPKDNYVFTKVSQGRTVIWESTSDVNGTSVRTKTVSNIKYLVLLLSDNTFKLFNEEGNKWNDLTSDRYDIKKLKFFGDNDTPLKSSDLKVTLQDLSYKYTFNTNITCLKITYNDNPLWTHNEDPSFAEIKSLSFDLTKDQFSVTNTSDQTKHLTKAKVSLEIKTTESTNEFDYKLENGVITFTPKDNHLFSKVVDGISDIWVSKDNHYGTLVRIKDFGGVRYLLVVQDNNSFSLFQVAGEWTDLTSNRPNLTKLRFFGEGDSELSQNDFEVTLQDLSYKYTFKEGVNCSKIMYNNKALWTHTDYTNFSEIKSLHLDLPNNRFLITNPQDQTKELVKPTKVSLDIEMTEYSHDFKFTDESGLLTFKPKSNRVFSKVSEGPKAIWESMDDVYGTLVRTKTVDGVKYLAVLMDNNTFKLFHLVSGNWNDLTSDRYDVTKLKFFGDNDAELKSSDLEVTLVDLSYTILFNTGVVCRKIMLGDDEVWKHTDDPNFSSIKSLSLDLPTNKFSVTNTSDQTKQLDKPAKETSAQVTPTTPTGSTAVTNPTKVTLDLNSNQTTNEFIFADQNGVFTYTAKSDHVFNKVSQGNTVIWESKNDVYATSVKSKTVDNKKYLAILLSDNTFTVFHLGGDSFDMTSTIYDNMFTVFNVETVKFTDLTSDIHDVSKLKFFGDNNVELKSSDFDFNTFDLSYEYKFNDDVNCRKITYDDMPLWRHTDDPNYSSIKSLQLDIPSNKFFVKNHSDQSKELVKPNRVTLDINKTKTTGEFEYTHQNGLKTFTAKPSHLFSKLVEGPKAVWDSRYDAFGTMVMTKDNEGVRYLALLLDNHLFKVFKDDASEWKDVTLNRPDLSRLKFLGENDAELKPSDYTVSLSNFSFTYQFKSGVKCKKVMLGEEEVWKDTEDPKFSSLKSFSLGLCSKRFYVKNLDNQCKRLPFEPKPAKETSAPVISFAKPASQITLDLDKTDYTDEYTDQNNVITYTPMPTNVFSKVVDGTRVVWESSDCVYGTLAVTKYKDGVRYLVLHLTDNTFKLFKQSEEDNPWTNITDKRHDLMKLKFFGEGDVVLTSDFEVMLVNLSFTYKFKDDVKCLKITYNDNPLWTHTDDTNFSSIKSVSLDLPTNQFSVTNSSSESKQVVIKVSLDLENSQSTDEFEYSDQNGLVTFTPKRDHVFSKVSQGTTNIWESKTNVCGTLVRTKVSKNVNYVVLQLSDNTFKLFKEQSDGTFEDITDKGLDLMKLKFLGENDTEITKTDYTVKLAYLSYEYKFKDGVKCVKITYNNNILWSHTDDPSFSEIKSLSLDIPTNILYVMNPSSSLKKLDIKVTLDLNTNHSTTEFSYSKDPAGVVTYTPKTGHVFSKVVEGNTVIWESKNDVHGTLVRTTSVDNVKYLVLLLSDNTFKLFHEHDNIPWHDITSNRYDVTRLKFFGDNDTELKSSDFQVTLQDLSFEFKFNTGVKCLKITYNDNQLWSHTDDSNFSSIKSLSFDLPKDQFSVTNPSDQTKQLTKANTLILDLNATQTTNEFDFNYQNGVVTFTPKSGHLFKKVVQGPTPVWESFDPYGTLVRTKTEDNKKYLAILMDNNTFSLFHQEGDFYDMTSTIYDNMFTLFHDEYGKWNVVTSQRYDLSKLKFLGENDTELTSSDYEVTLQDLSYELKFNTGVNCKKILHHDRYVWTHTDDTNFQSLKSLSLDLPTNRLYVKNSSDQSKELDIKVALDLNATESTNEYDYTDKNNVITFTAKSNHVFSKVSQGPKDIWESTGDLYATLVSTMSVDNKKYLAMLLTNNSFKLFNEESGDWKDLTKDRHDVTKVRFLDDNETPLSKSSYTVTLQGLSYTIKFNTGVNCKKITHSNVQIWTHTDDPNFSEIKSLSLNLPRNKFLVTNKSDGTKELNIKVSLDLSKSFHSTDHYDFNDQNGLKTYTTKDNCLFTKVSQGNTLIWESIGDVFGRLVMSTADQKYLALLLTDNMFKVFHLDGNDWKDITSQRHDIKKLKFFGDNDTELSKTDYSVNIVFLSFTYIFNTGVMCRKVKYGDAEVWKDTDDPKFAEIKSFSLGLASNSFFVKNLSNQSKKLDFKPTPVTTPETKATPADTTKTKVTLDLEKTESTSEFSRSDQNNVVTFTPKTSHVFNKVTHGTTVVWESTNNVYASLVMLRTEGNKKFLVIFLTDNTFTVFHKEGAGGDFFDMTTTIYDNMFSLFHEESSASDKSSESSGSSKSSDSDKPWSNVTSAN